jgi:hypothetical protein
VYAIANGKLVCRPVGNGLPEEKMRSKREFLSAQPVAIEEGARWKLYHKGALVAGAITKQIKEIVEHNLVQCYFRSKARESTYRLGETKTDHYPGTHGTWSDYLILTHGTWSDYLILESYDIQ